MSCVSYENDIPRGYFKVTDVYERRNIPYIKCDGSICTKLSEPSSVVTNCEKNLGNLVKDLLTMDVKVCASLNRMVGFTDIGKTSIEILSVDGANNVLVINPDDKYVLVTKNEDSIVPTDVQDSKINEKIFI